MKLLMLQSVARQTKTVSGVGRRYLCQLCLRTQFSFLSCLQLVVDELQTEIIAEITAENSEAVSLDTGKWTTRMDLIPKRSMKSHPPASAD